MFTKCGFRVYNKQEAQANIFSEVHTMKYVCDVCGWEYDETLGDAEHGIAPGTKFEVLPEDFECPLCGVDKSQFSAN